jgi:hypothetical protein
MNAQDYKAGVLQTESVPAKLEIHEVRFHAILMLIAATTTIADQAKRKLFYGKDFDQTKLMDALNAVANMADYLGAVQEEDADGINRRVVDRSELAALPAEIASMDLDKVNIRLLHSALGIFTEGGETVAAIQKQFETGELDLINFAEELGDVDWYKIIGNDASGVPEEVERRLNNQKLTDKRAGRYRKGAFTVQDAINRDLEAERTQLTTRQVNA